MDKIETALKTGIKCLHARIQSDGTYIYIADETGGTYRVTREDIIDLGNALLSDDAATRRDAYSLWCTQCGEEAKAKMNSQEIKIARAASRIAGAVFDDAAGSLEERLEAAIAWKNMGTDGDLTHEDRMSLHLLLLMQREAR